VTRISDGTYRGNASWSREYAIGYHNCTACNAETPGPPQDVLDNLARHHSTVSTVWPFEHWQPAGWMKIGPEYGEICPACSRAVMTLLKNRPSEVRPNDHAIVESAMARAIYLADDALLSANPPPPEPYKENEFGTGYRYKHPGTDYVYRSIADYHMGWMRERIRQIRSVLTGKPEAP
jgi:hypothetical protein